MTLPTQSKFKTNRPKYIFFSKNWLKLTNWLKLVKKAENKLLT